MVDQGLLSCQSSLAEAPCIVYHCLYSGSCWNVLWALPWYYLSFTIWSEGWANSCVSVCMWLLNWRWSWLWYVESVVCSHYCLFFGLGYHSLQLPQCLLLWRIFLHHRAEARTQTTIDYEVYNQLLSLKNNRFHPFFHFSGSSAHRAYLRFSIRYSTML